MSDRAKVTYNPNLDRGSIEYPGGPWIDFQFQHGPIATAGFNGLQNEELIELLMERLKALDLRLPCSENENALMSLRSALFWLEERRKLRRDQGLLDQPDRAHTSKDVKAAD